MDDELLGGVTAVAFAARSIERALDNMTLPQFRVLMMIASSPERASRLADRLAVSPPSLTGILDGLVSRGWVARSEVDGDRPGVTLTITAAGAKAMETAKGATTDALDALLEGADAKQRAKVLTGLTTLRALLTARSDAKVNS